MKDVIRFLPYLEVGLDRLKTANLSRAERAKAGKSGKHSFYICDSIQDQMIDGGIDSETMNDIHYWLDENKPTPTEHKKFFNHPHYIENKDNEEQQIGWWRGSIGNLYGERPSSMELSCHQQRILFLQHLISIIKVDNDIPLS